MKDQLNGKLFKSNRIRIEKFNTLALQKRQKMIRRIILSFLCLHLFAGVIFIQYRCFAASAENVWQEVINSDGIVVWERAVEGSSFNEFKGETIIPVNKTEVLKILWDIKAFPKWLPDVTKAEIIKEINDDTIIYHDTTTFPWPISDRDCIIRINKRNISNRAIEVKLNDIKDFNIPNSDGTVRVNDLRGRYSLESLGQENTKISYQLYYDPAGRIPSMIVNPGLRDNIYDTLKRLTEITQKR
jgi:ribosome-associated toxin RatA of RatAB toxin-antitoxin module